MDLRSWRSSVCPDSPRYPDKLLPASISQHLVAPVSDILNRHADPSEPRAQSSQASAEPWFGVARAATRLRADAKQGPQRR